MSHAWITAVVMVVALGGGCEGFSIRPELAGLLKAEEIHKQFELLEILLGKLVNGSNCRNRTQDAAEETTEIEPEGEGTTMAPESEEEVEDEKEKNKDYEKLHQNHTMLLPPNADCNVTKTGITDEEKDFILELHNDLRSYVAYGNESQGDPGPQPPAANMHQLVWNEELAEVAQAWASQCPSGHDEEKKRRLLSRKYHTGQNINYYWGTDDNGSDWEKAIKNWYNEVMDVDAKIAAAFIPHNTKKIGHYTQLIWGNTKEIGCGIVYYATERKGFYFPYSITYVCNYGPSGNFINMPFYEHGPAATKCPGKVSTEYSALCA
ncbi:venom allergen 5-like [Scylla paramamosain]|uniref:venom allergen 5-like n=1 Tax=Scylla paramamosain TaxID=85552 RepID=UPI003082B35E